MGTAIPAVEDGKDGGFLGDVQIKSPLGGVS